MGNLSPFILISFITFSLLYPSITSISFTIPTFHPNTPNIAYEGDAMLTNDGKIQLNRGDFLCRVGHATFSQNIHLWDEATQTLSDFNTNFTFSIDTGNATRYGSGFAFFIAPSNFQIPPNTAGGFLGLLNTTMIEGDLRSNGIVAVEFDSFSNPEWDPPVEHVGVIVNSLEPAAYVGWNAAKHSGKVGHARVSYDASAKMLEVSVEYGEEGNYQLSYGVDLMKIVAEWIKIGFSGATGKYTELNFIHSWEFSSTL